MILPLLFFNLLFSTTVLAMPTFNTQYITPEFPLCIYNESDLIYSDTQGNSVDTYNTFLKCLSRVNGPKLIPSLNQTEPIVVYTSIQLNNIGNIDPAGDI